MKHFTESEFDRCTPSCSMAQMDAAFLDLLDRVREEAGRPVVLTCAYRSKEWDIEHGRTGNSAHTRGKAADLRVTDSAERLSLIRAALAVGVRRIGIGKTFLHIDADDTLPQDVCWTYYD